jgi:hypothetical protein
VSGRPTAAKVAPKLTLDDSDELVSFARLLWAAAAAAGKSGTPPPWQAKIDKIVGAIMRDEYQETVEREIRRALAEVQGVSHDLTIVPRDKRE